MRRSSIVTLTVLPMLASAAVAAAQPIAPPGMTESKEPELSPPGMTPHIWELACEEDPNWQLRQDCPRKPILEGEEVEVGEGEEGEVSVSYEGSGIWRGGFGHYFSGGSSGGARGSSGS